jgi:hypothetical protein
MYIVVARLRELYFADSYAEVGMVNLSKLYSFKLTLEPVHNSVGAGSICLKKYFPYSVSTVSSIQI